MSTPITPSLKVTEVFKDYIVSSTVYRLEDSDAGFIPPSERGLERNPVVATLIATQSLDSRTAAILVAEQMVRGNDHSTWMPYLTDETKTVVPLLTGASSPERLTAGLIREGSDSALKIGVAAIVQGITPDTISMMEGYLGKEDLQKAMKQAVGPVSSLAEAVAKSPVAHESKLIDRFLVSMSLISAHSEVADAKRVESSMQILRAAIAKPAAPKAASVPTP